ncbi:MAG: hydroxyacid dehydrogenase [Candidatus Heteroscillospira sp.]|jgi:D-3-phosphoglycerate dehydrogenase
MSYKILIPQYVPDSSIQRLYDLGCQVVTSCGCSEQELISAIEGADAVIARTAPYTEAVIKAARNLKIIARYGVGVDNIDLDAAAREGIWVSNTPFSNLVSVAEHTVGMLLALAKNFRVADRELRCGNFSVRNQLTGTDLQGKTIGLIGMGRIGSLVAKKCFYGLDMKVLAYDPYLPPDKVPDGVELSTSWESVFQTADVISMHLPLNSSTRGIVGAREFAMMKKSAYFINCARGEIVDEQALIQALKQGQIAAAALDVYANENPGENNPLFGLENTLLTPHTASFTHEAYHRLGVDAVACVENVLFKHEPPLWAVNRPNHPRIG